MTENIEYWELTNGVMYKIHKVNDWTMITRMSQEEKEGVFSTPKKSNFFTKFIGFRVSF